MDIPDCILRYLIQSKDRFIKASKASENLKHDMTMPGFCVSFNKKIADRDFYANQYHEAQIAILDYIEREFHG